jgi:hypothetical protein
MLPLDREHLDWSAWSYAVVRAHDLWLYAAIYRQHEDRVRQFLSPHGFVDPYAAWQRLNAHLE